MYRIIHELPFNVMAVWYKLFETEEQAKIKVRKLPDGFVVIEDTELINLLPLRTVSIVPFDKKLET